MGFFCPKGSFKPYPCTFKFQCEHKMLTYPEIGELGGLYMLGAISLAFLFFSFSNWIRTKLRAERRRQQEKLLEARLNKRAEGRKQKVKHRWQDAISSSSPGRHGHKHADGAAEDTTDAASTENHTSTTKGSRPISVPGDYYSNLEKFHNDSVSTCCGCDILTHYGLFFISGIVIVVASTLFAVQIDFGEFFFIVVMIIFPVLLTIGACGIYRLRMKRSNGKDPGSMTGSIMTRVLKSGSENGSRKASWDRMDASELSAMRTKKTTRMNIEVEDLGLRLNSNGKQVLKGVNGFFHAGTVTAVMGPSGAGKTTFLNTLAAAASYGTSTGVVRINGKEDSVKNFSSIVGFVPQEDIMHRDMTVREILKTYAILRTPSKYFDAARRERLVQDVIEVLQLQHVADSVIGDESKRGISGGQRKRVNIGMEMVCDPSLLFLDEPTSGLDSTTSYDVVGALQAIAKKGCNVILVLHQPSFPLYKMFTAVLLLGKGGRTVYLGRSMEALKYFESIGFSLPDMVNPGCTIYTAFPSPLFVLIVLSVHTSEVHLEPRACPSLTRVPSTSFHMHASQRTSSWISSAASTSAGAIRTSPLQTSSSSGRSPMRLETSLVRLPTSRAWKTCSWKPSQSCPRSSRSLRPLGSRLPSGSSRTVLSFAMPEEETP